MRPCHVRLQGRVGGDEDTWSRCEWTDTGWINSPKLTSGIVKTRALRWDALWLSPLVVQKQSHQVLFLSWTLPGDFRFAPHSHPLKMHLTGDYCTFSQVHSSSKYHNLSTRWSWPNDYRDVYGDLTLSSQTCLWLCSVSLLSHFFFFFKWLLTTGVLVKLTDNHCMCIIQTASEVTGNRMGGSLWWDVAGLEPCATAGGASLGFTVSMPQWAPFDDAASPLALQL